MSQKRTEPGGASLPAPQGLPDLGVIFRFTQGNAIQTLHQIIVYLARSAAKYLSQSQETGVNGRISLISNVDRLLKVAGTVGLFIGKSFLKMSTLKTDIDEVKPRKKTSRRKRGNVSLSVVMPARQEIDNLRSAYERITDVIKKADITDYEILLMTVNNPDGTSDDTHLVAEAISQEDKRVHSFHSRQFCGLGYKFREAVGEAAKRYVTVIPGDGEFEEDSVVELMTNIGKADIIIPYIGNPEVRPPERQIVSRGFVVLCNSLFGLNLRYYNGPCIIPTDYIRAVPMSCDNFAFMAEVLVFLIKSGASYLEMPWKLKPSGVSKAFKTESITEALETLVSLFWKINVDGQRVRI